MSLPANRAKTRTNPGQAFQDLVADLERTLGVLDGYAVESPKRLRDRHTGLLREFDVIVALKAGHYSTLTALECRDKGRPVGVNEVSEFAAKCTDCGVHQGVIVSSRGFRNSALVKANAIGIGCLTLGARASFDWLTTHRLTRWTRTGITPVNFVLDFQSMPFSGTPRFVDGSGRPWGDAERTALANEVMTNHSLAGDEVHGGVYSREVILNDPDVFLLTWANARIRARFVKMQLHYRVDIEEFPLRLVSYRDEANGEVRFDVAVAELIHDGVEGRLMAIRGSDEFVKLSWIPTGGPAVAGRTPTIQLNVKSADAPDR